MTQYIELYKNSIFKLYGRNSVTGEIYFHVEICSTQSCDFSNIFSGTCTFCITNDEVEKYCKQLERMYSLLKGECLILDYDFGNELKLYFDGRQLKIDGKFCNSWYSSQFRGEDVDQTIILPIISLLKNSLL